MIIFNWKIVNFNLKIIKKKIIKNSIYLKSKNKGKKQ